MFTLKRGIDWMGENIRWCEWAIGEVERNRALFPAENMRTQIKLLIPLTQSATAKWPVMRWSQE